MRARYWFLCLVVVVAGTFGAGSGHAQSAATDTATPSPQPAATPSPTPTSKAELEQIWTSTMQTESNMTSVHSKGTLSDNTGSISFVGNCAPKAAFDIQLTGKNKAGKLITVEYLTVKSGFWSRSHGAKKAWGKWKKGPGYNADIFIQFVSILCPQLDAQELAKATLSQVDTLVNDLGDEQVAATPVRHLQLASSGSSLDIYFAQSTYYWVLLKTFDQSSQLQTSVTYSRFNQVKLKAPG